MGSALGGVAKVAGGFIVAEGLMSMGGFLKDAAQAAAEDEQATARLEQALRNVGGSFDENVAKINDRIKVGEKLAFSDDDVRDSFQKLVASTGDVDEALSRQTLAMDFARGAGIPLAQASTLLGKVTAENVEVFKRMGITIGEGATEAEAMAVIQAKFGGQSEAYAKSTAGQFEVTKLKMGELKEQIGAQLLPVMTKMGSLLVEEVIPKIEQFAGFWEANVQPKIAAFVAWVQPKIAEFGAIIQAEFVKFQGYYEKDVKPAFDNIMAAVSAVVAFIAANWPQIAAIIEPVMLQVKAVVETVMGIVQNVITLVLNVISGDWSAAWQNIQNILSLAWEFIKATVTNSMELVKGLLAAGWALIQSLIGAAWEGIKAAVSAGIENVVRFMSELPGKVMSAIASLAGMLWDEGVKALTNLRDGAASMVGSLMGYIGDIPGRIAGAIGDLGGLLWQKGKDLIQGMVNGMRSVSIPNPLGMIPGGGFVGKIPGFAGGVENFRGGLAIVGESGPELVSLPRGASVHTAQESRAMLSGMGSSGGVTVNIQNVNATNADEARRAGANIGYSISSGLAARGLG